MFSDRHAVSVIKLVASAHSSKLRLTPDTKACAYRLNIYSNVSTAAQQGTKTVLKFKSFKIVSSVSFGHTNMWGWDVNKVR